MEQTQPTTQPKFSEYGFVSLPLLTKPFQATQKANLEKDGARVRCLTLFLLYEVIYNVGKLMEDRTRLIKIE